MTPALPGGLKAGEDSGVKIALEHAPGVPQPRDPARPCNAR